MPVADKRDVLVVEDDEGIRKLVCTVLTRAGLSCDPASDGLAALERVTSCEYSVILLDLMMPGLDGLGFLAELRKLETVLVFMPIVFLMSAASEEAIIEDAGDLIQALIRKPFDIQELAEIVIGCVRARKAREYSTGQQFRDEGKKDQV